jgi:hypothetical protein
MKTERSQILEYIKAASPRVHRLYVANAFQMFSQYAQHPKSDQIVKFVLQYDDMEACERTEAMMTSCRALARDILQSASVAGEKVMGYQIRIARDVLVHMVQEKMDLPKMWTAMWGMRGPLGAEFDYELLDDMGLRGNRPMVASHAHWPLDVARMAAYIYETQDYTGAGALSDAIEEAGGPQAWCDQLRKGRHWKGCYVIDSILGKE